MLNHIDTKVFFRDVRKFEFYIVYQLGTFFAQFYNMKTVEQIVFRTQDLSELLNLPVTSLKCTQMIAHTKFVSRQCHFFSLLCHGYGPSYVRCSYRMSVLFLFSILPARISP